MWLWQFLDHTYVTPVQNWSQLAMTFFKIQLMQLLFLNARILTEMRINLYSLTIILFIISLEIPYTVALCNTYVGLSIYSMQVHPKKSGIK